MMPHVEELSKSGSLSFLILLSAFSPPPRRLSLFVEPCCILISLSISDEGSSAHSRWRQERRGLHHRAEARLLWFA